MDEVQTYEPEIDDFSKMQDNIASMDNFDSLYDDDNPAPDFTDRFDDEEPGFMDDNAPTTTIEPGGFEDEDSDFWSSNAPTTTIDNPEKPEWLQDFGDDSETDLQSLNNSLMGHELDNPSEQSSTVNLPKTNDELSLQNFVNALNWSDSKVGTEVHLARPQTMASPLHAVANVGVGVVAAVATLVGALVGGLTSIATGGKRGGRRKRSGGVRRGRGFGAFHTARYHGSHEERYVVEIEKEWFTQVAVELLALKVEVLTFKYKRDYVEFQLAKNERVKRVANFVLEKYGKSV